MPALNPIYERIPELYLSTNMNAPLAEQTPNVVQFELTTGCSHNACSYCDVFGGVKYHARPVQDFKRHVDDVMEELERRSELGDLERIYLGGGDALSINPGELKVDISHAIRRFKEYTGKVPRRISMYASINNILDAGADNLQELHCGGKCGQGCSKDWLGTRLGLELIYLGLETGSETLLKEIKKGYDLSDVYHAIDILHRVGAGSFFSGVSRIRVSAFVMPGLGGVKHSQDHVEGTVRILNRLRPSFVNLTTIMAHPETLYARKMEREIEEGTNRPLSSGEVAEQIAQIIEKLDFETKIGCCDNSLYLGANTNPINFPTTRLEYAGGMFGGTTPRQFARQVRTMTAAHPN
jgi:radical SAM superfamily enzyme YgiQ (UPF0313 family)